jgi:hypothetical protein
VTVISEVLRSIVTTTLFGCVTDGVSSNDDAGM